MIEGLVRFRSKSIHPITKYYIRLKELVIASPQKPIGARYGDII